MDTNWIKEQVRIDDAGAFAFNILGGIILWVIGITQFNNLEFLKGTSRIYWILTLGIILILVEVAYYMQIKHCMFGGFLDKMGLIGIKMLLIIMMPIWIFGILCVIAVPILTVGLLIYGSIALWKIVMQHPMQTAWIIITITFVVMYFISNYYWGKKLQNKYEHNKEE